MMLPGEFFRVHRNIPWKQRPGEWWDTFSFVVSVIIAVVSTIVIGTLYPEDGFDIIAMVLIIILSFLFIRFGSAFDRVLIPLQPPLMKLPGLALTVVGLVFPFITAFLLNAFSGLTSYALIVLNVIIGTCIASLFLKIPRSFRGSARTLPPGLHLLAGTMVLCALIITRAAASSAMFPGCTMLCPVSIGFAGAITAAVSAAVNSPSVVQRISGKRLPSAMTAVISGKPAQELLAGNGLATLDTARKGFVPAPAYAGWMQRPAADPLPVRGSRVIGEEKDRVTGKVTLQKVANVASIDGFHIELNPDGTLRAECLALVVEQTQATRTPPAVPQAPTSPPGPGQAPSPGQSTGGAGGQAPVETTAIGGAAQPGGGGIDEGTVGRVVDIAGGSVQTTVDFAGTSYGVGESEPVKGGIPGAGKGAPAPAGEGRVLGEADAPARDAGTAPGTPDRFCRNCGATATPTMKFCGRCGKELYRPPLAGEVHVAAESAGATPGSPGGMDMKTTGRVMDVAGSSVQTTVDFAGTTYAAGEPQEGRQPGVQGEMKGSAAPSHEARVTRGADTAQSRAGGASGLPARFCRNCGAPVALSMKFCGQCGREVSQVLPSTQPVCSRCGGLLIPGKKFCSACGAPVNQGQGQAICPQCGREILPGSVFCRGCGKRLR
jgi:uncharacterized OB-fold protein